jgi:hypothetical protein
MPQALRPISVTNVAGLGTLTSTTTSTATQLPLADSYTVVFDVSSVSGTSPTYDIVMQTSWDKGTTYINCPLRSAQITTAGVHWNMFSANHFDFVAATQAGVADTGGAVNKDFIFDPQYVKFKVTVGGTSPSAVVAVRVFCVPRADGCS